MNEYVINTFNSNLDIIDKNFSTLCATMDKNIAHLNTRLNAISLIQTEHKTIIDKLNIDPDDSDELKPNELKPDEPNELKPSEPKPNELKPSELKPNEPKPNELKPNELKPSELKPSESNESTKSHRIHEYSDKLITMEKIINNLTKKITILENRISILEGIPEKIPEKI